MSGLGLFFRDHYATAAPADAHRGGGGAAAAGEEQEAIIDYHQSLVSLQLQNSADDADDADDDAAADLVHNETYGGTQRMNSEGEEEEQQTGTDEAHHQDWVAWRLERKKDVLQYFRSRFFVHVDDDDDDDGGCDDTEQDGDNDTDDGTNSRGADAVDTATPSTPSQARHTPPPPRTRPGVAIPRIQDATLSIDMIADLDLHTTRFLSVTLCSVAHVVRLRSTRRDRYYYYCRRHRPSDDGPLGVMYAHVLSLEILQHTEQLSVVRQRAELLHPVHYSNSCIVHLYGLYAKHMNEILMQLATFRRDHPGAKLFLALRNVPAKCLLPNAGGEDFFPTSCYCLCIGPTSTLNLPKNDGGESGRIRFDGDESKEFAIDCLIMADATVLAEYVLEPSRGTANQGKEVVLNAMQVSDSPIQRALYKYRQACHPSKRTAEVAATMPATSAVAVLQEPMAAGPPSPPEGDVNRADADTAAAAPPNGAAKRARFDAEVAYTKLVRFVLGSALRFLHLRCAHNVFALFFSEISASFWTLHL
jgi:hypothetical protein